MKPGKFTRPTSRKHPDGEKQVSEQSRVAIAQLPTGVPGLDVILGGGLPEYSFNLITGTAGVGKTTLAHQIIFTLATDERPALYFTLLGEPPLKMLRYQQQLAFFDPAKIGRSIHFHNLSNLILTEDLPAVLGEIVRQVEAANPALVIVDSFQTATRELNPVGLQDFLQRLAVRLTSWQATTFLIGEYFGIGGHSNPVSTVADGIIWLSQTVERNSVVRKIQIRKCRGQALVPGLHSFRLSDTGIQIFPRVYWPAAERLGVRAPARLLSGVPGLDALLGGGIPAGDSLLVSGSAGAGKSVLAAQFIAAGAANGEPGVIVLVEEHPRQYVQRAAGFGLDLAAFQHQHLVEVIYLRTLDLSPDEALHEIQNAVQRLGAQRVVIDSLSGFELALAPGFREDFRESLNRLVGALTTTGTTVLLTAEALQTADVVQFSPHLISFLADDILQLRYVEIAGELRKSLTVIKMRNSVHSTAFYEYAITGKGFVVRSARHDRRTVSSDRDEPRSMTGLPRYAGLIEEEAVVLEALTELGEASPDRLAARTGFATAALMDALGRLVHLTYVTQRESPAGALYQPVAHRSEPAW
jgi:circadian clock protein KaiC